MVQRTFGRYELLERIDVGGMAEVFRAKQRGAAGFERVVAVKKILPYIAEDPDIREMFVEEAKLAVQLNHPNIAQVFDLGKVGEDYFIAMEFVDGHSVRTLMSRFSDRSETIPEEVVCHLLVEVAEALHHAHFAEDGTGSALGIIHRDVSPHNILISFEGEVKVIDFGLAKAANRASQTRDGVVKGKLAYLSPEQAHGRPIDRRTDLFALGICAWEMLTGERAFKRRDDRETVLAIRAGRVDPPSRHAEVSPELEAIVMRALAVDPDDRYRTALELRNAVEAHRRAAGHRFGKRDMRALMRATFPERFATEAEPGAAIELIKKKPPKELEPLETQPQASPPAPAPPPIATVIDLVEDVLGTDPGEAWEEPTDTQQRAADDTVPGIEIPEDR